MSLPFTARLNLLKQKLGFPISGDLIDVINDLNEGKSGKKLVYRRNAVDKWIKECSKPRLGRDLIIQAFWIFLDRRGYLPGNYSTERGFQALFNLDDDFKFIERIDEITPDRADGDLRLRGRPASDFIGYYVLFRLGLTIEEQTDGSKHFQRMLRSIPAKIERQGGGTSYEESYLGEYNTHGVARLVNNRLHIFGEDTRPGDSALFMGLIDIRAKIAGLDRSTMPGVIVMDGDHDSPTSYKLVLEKYERDSVEGWGDFVAKYQCEIPLHDKDNSGSFTIDRDFKSEIHPRRKLNSILSFLSIRKQRMDLTSQF